jgi:hypothetical protein
MNERTLNLKLLVSDQLEELADMLVSGHSKPATNGRN